MRTTQSRFGELDDLVLRLKGLVLVRELRKRGHPDQEELERFSDEIRRVRDRLADLVRNGGGVERPAAGGRLGGRAEARRRRREGDLVG